MCVRGSTGDWVAEGSGGLPRARAKGSRELPNAGAPESRNLNFTNTGFSGVLHVGYQSVAQAISPFTF